MPHLFIKIQEAVQVVMSAQATLETILLCFVVSRLRPSQKVWMEQEILITSSRVLGTVLAPVWEVIGGTSGLYYCI